MPAAVEVATTGDDVWRPPTPTGALDERVPSSVIRSFEYDAPRRELRIRFQSGRRYVYRGVPEQTFRAMRAAFAKGEFFNTEIRGRFPFSRIDAGDDEPGARSPRESTRG